MSKTLRAYCFIFACSSMLYYLLLTRLLAEFTGDVMFWTAVSSGIFLLANGIGVYWSERLFKQNVFRLVASIETGLAAWGALAVVALYLWHMVYRSGMYEFGYKLDDQALRPIYLFGGVAQLLICGVGVLSGLEFGLVNQMVYRGGLDRVQKLLVVYQFGGLLGTLLLLLALVPHYEPLLIAFGVAAVNLVAVAGWTWQFRAATAGPATWRLTSLSALGLTAAFVLCQQYDLAQLQRKNFYYNDLGWAMDSAGRVRHYRPYSLWEWPSQAGAYPDIRRYRGLYQNIDIVPDFKSRMAVTELEDKDGWSLFMDGHFEVSSFYESDYHQALAHVPQALLGQPGGRILVIGGGDGLLVRELLRYGDKTEQITLIDIDPQILSLAGRLPRLLKLNQAALLDPKVKLVATDAFQALRHSAVRYDKIYVDVLFPYNFETSRLYSLEFLASLRLHLAPTGYVAVLSPVEISELGDPEDQHILQVMTSTLRQAGFADLYLFGEVRHSFLLGLPLALAPERVADVKKSPYWRFIDHPEQMDKVEHLTGALQPKLVNSILKPTFFGQPDTNF